MINNVRPTTIQITQIYGQNGQRMKRGAICIKNTTRLSYRSLTGVFHILIQVSKEMFDWDAYGYLQYQETRSTFLKRVNYTAFNFSFMSLRPKTLYEIQSKLQLKDPELRDTLQEI